MAKKTRKSFDIRSAIYDRSREAETGVTQGYAIQDIGPNGKPVNLLTIKVSGMDAAKERVGTNLREHILENNEIVPGTVPATELVKGKLKKLSTKLSYDPDEIVSILDDHLGYEAGTKVEDDADAANERMNAQPASATNGATTVD